MSYVLVCLGLQSSESLQEGWMGVVEGGVQVVRHGEAQVVLVKGNQC